MNSEADTHRSDDHRGRASEQRPKRDRMQLRLNNSVAPVTLKRLAAIESEWRALEKKASSYAQSYDYARAALSIAEEKGERSFLVTLRDEKVLRGVWGLTLTRETLHAILRPFSCGTNEEFSWPLLDDPALAETAFRQAASLAGTADILMIYNAPAQSPIDQAAAALPFPQVAGSIDGVIIPSSRYATWVEAEKGLSNGMRYNLRSRGKKLAQQGALAIGWCDSVEEADKAIGFYFERKAQWLKEQGKHSPYAHKPEVPEFFRRLVRATDNPVVAAVRLDGVFVAVGICLVGPRAIEYHMTTFDPKYAAYGPAQLLVRFLAEWAIERRRDFDFGIAVYGYKEQWPVEHRTYVTRKVKLTMRGRIPEPREVERVARSKLGGARRRLLSLWLKVRLAGGATGNSPRSDR